MSTHLVYFIFCSRVGGIIVLVCVSIGYSTVGMGDKKIIQGGCCISNTHDYHQSYAPLYLIGVNVYCVQ